jgi:hypothetical protein
VVVLVEEVAAWDVVVVPASEVVVGGRVEVVAGVEVVAVCVVLVATAAEPLVLSCAVHDPTMRVSNAPTKIQHSLTSVISWPASHEPPFAASAYPAGRVESR